jgi:hypothetical protein
MLLKHVLSGKTVPVAKFHDRWQLAYLKVNCKLFYRKIKLVVTFYYFKNTFLSKYQNKLTVN